MYNENHHVKAKNMPNRGSKNISPVYLNTDEIENEKADEGLRHTILHKVKHKNVVDDDL